MSESLTSAGAARAVALGVLLLTPRLLTAQAPAAELGPQVAAVTLAETPGFLASRTGKAVVVRLKVPHRVVSTSAITGGVSTTLRALVNHQSLEPSSHTSRSKHIVALGRDGFHEEVARDLGFDPRDVAIIGTAASMNHLSWRHAEHRGLRVDAFVTGGVETNATRAGDPARWFEGETGAQRVPDAGTINTILLVNQPLAVGADVRAAVTMVEAKSAALAELGVPSRQSTHLATGTGTDQFVVATPLDLTRRALTDPGAHFKLGDLIGRAVREATLEALRWQNGLDAAATRAVGRILGRFGLSEDALFARLETALDEESRDLLARNRSSLTMEPRLAAAAFAYASVLDRLQYGSLPEPLANETLRDQAATAAVSLSGAPERWAEFWRSIPDARDDRLAPFVVGVALGWESRWAPRPESPARPQVAPDRRP